MPAPRIRSVAHGLSVALIMVACSLGCGSVRPLPFQPGDPLDSGDGLLVLHIRSDTPLKSISLGGGTPVPLDLPSGNHLRVIRLRAGSYRWSRLELPETVDPTRFGWRGKPLPLVFQFPWEDDLNFSVEA